MAAAGFAVGTLGSLLPWYCLVKYVNHLPESSRHKHWVESALDDIDSGKIIASYRAVSTLRVDVGSQIEVAFVTIIGAGILVFMIPDYIRDAKAYIKSSPTPGSAFRRGVGIAVYSQIYAGLSGFGCLMAYAMIREANKLYKLDDRLRAYKKNLRDSDK